MMMRTSNNNRQSPLSSSTSRRTKKPVLWISPKTIVLAAIVLWMCMIVAIWIRLPQIEEASSLSSTGNNNVNFHHQYRPVEDNQEYVWNQDSARRTGNAHFVDLDHPPRFLNNIKNQQQQQQASNNITVLHTLLTRLMIGQPNQPILANARLKLFETFCLPTVRSQTYQNFYWIILADPRIDVVKDLQNLLNPMPNAYLILTTNTSWAADGIGVPNVTNYGIDIVDIVEEYYHYQHHHQKQQAAPFDIVSGNLTRLSQLRNELLRFQQQQSSTAPNDNDSNNNSNNNTTILMKIETLLDADDGLHYHAIEWLQKEAFESITKYTPNNPTLESTWKIICATNQIEWHNRDVYMLSESKYKQFGISSGITGLRKLPTFCPSAGFTRMGMVRLSTSSSSTVAASSSMLHFPQEAYVNHGTVHLKFPYCSISSTPTICWKRDEFPTVALIVKTRTITSDSMDNLNPQSYDYKDVEWEQDSTQIRQLWVNESESTWNILQSDFAISRYQAWMTSIYLYEHAEQILDENKAARCIPGFPCRDVTTENIMKLKNHFYRKNKDDRREEKKKHRDHQHHDREKDGNEEMMK